LEFAAYTRSRTNRRAQRASSTCPRPDSKRFPIPLPAFHKGCATAVTCAAGPRELRINLNGAGVIDNGALIFTLIIIDKAARVVGAGEVRVELYSSGQISNSRVELAQLAMNESAVEIGDGILRVSPDNKRS